MKLIIKTLLFLLLLPSNLMSQVDTKGFFLDGGIAYNQNEASYKNLRSSLSVGYFLNLSHNIQVNTNIQHTQFNTFVNGQISEQKSTSTNFGVSYEYVHWIQDRIGVGTQIGIQDILEGPYVPVRMKLYARINDYLDLGFNVLNFNLYSSRTLPFNNINIITPPIVETEIQSYRDTKFSLLDQIISSFTIRLRVAPNPIGEESKPQEEITLPSAGIFVNGSYSKFESYDSLGTLINTTKSGGARLNLLINPLGTYAFGGAIEWSNIRGDNTLSSFSSNSYIFTPLVRRNWTTSKNFRMYAQASIGAGFSTSGNSDFSSTITSLSLSGGFNYIFKNRILLDVNMFNLGFSSSKIKRIDDRFNSFRLNFNQSNIISIGVLL